VRLCVSAATISGVSFFKNDSFCDAITSPAILSLPVENSFIASAAPVAIARKSASLISSVHLAPAAAPSATLPAPLARSIVHADSGPASLNANVVRTFSAIAGVPASRPPMARKMSALVVAGAAALVDEAGALALAFGLGISENSSMAAFEMTTAFSVRSLILQRKMIF
jgi:hypothetical protein